MQLLAPAIAMRTMLGVIRKIVEVCRAGKRVSGFVRGEGREGKRVSRCTDSERKKRPRGEGREKASCACCRADGEGKRRGEGN